MGYDLTMLVATRSSLTHEIGLVGRDVVPVYNNAPKPSSYFPDPNQEAVLPEATPVRKGSWFQVIAAVELCKACLPDWTCAFENSDGSHLYPLCEGNELLGLDMYGKYRNAIGIDVVIAELTRLVSGAKEPYRRFVIALAMLVTIRDSFVGQDVCCFFYGH